MCGGGNCGERPLWFQRAHWCRAICCCLDEKELVFVCVSYRSAVRVRILINNSASVCRTYPGIRPFCSTGIFLSYQDFQNTGGPKMKWFGGVGGVSHLRLLRIHWIVEYILLNWCEDINHGVYILAGKLRPCNESRTVGEKVGIVFFFS